MSRDRRKQGREGVREKVLRLIREEKLILPGDTVVAGVSGGADSVCLLLLLHSLQEELNFSLRVLHIEHGLRGEESLADADFVQALCGRLDVPCQVVSAPAGLLAKSRGLSTEEAARLFRYDAFEAACQALEEETEESTWRVKTAVAHHMEDQAETVLFQLARGSGLKGLAGMRPQRGRIIRPLLSLSREEIEDYLKEQGQSWRTDGTNLEDACARNRIRHQVLSALQEGVNAQSVLHICQAAHRVEDALRYIEGQADDFCGQWVHFSQGMAAIDLDPFRTQDRLIREYVLRRVISRLDGGAGLKDMGAVHIEDLLKLAEKPRGKRLDLPGRLKALRRDRQMLLYRE